MKKLTMAFTALLCAVISNAQFEQTRYLTKILILPVDIYSSDCDIAVVSSDGFNSNFSEDTYSESSLNFFDFFGIQVIKQKLLLRKIDLSL